MYTGNTVSNDEDGCRKGFSDHVTITKCGEREHVKNMAGFDDDSGGQTKPHGNPAHAEFKNKSDDGLPSFPAPFSKTVIKGGPAHPGTPA
jgi:hypothetical protein